MTASRYWLPNNLGDDPAANLAHFLLINADSIFAKWTGTIKAEDQRKLFGKYLGKRRIVNEGEKETIKMIVKVCFGTDFDIRENIKWRDL